MNATPMKKLHEGQEKSLAKCRDLISQWGKYKKDYEILHGKLKNLSDKVSHDMMVPLGTLALVPGKLIHTNEITVLLGDNWFAERSCKQACEIIQRRIKKCDDTLAKLREEEENTKNWMSCTEQMRNDTNEFVEIVEDYDEEKEKAWREQHRKNVQQHQKKVSEERKLALNAPTTSTQDIMRLPKPPSDDASSLSVAGSSSAGGDGDSDNDVLQQYNRRRRVSWQDQFVNSKEERKKEDEFEDEESAQTLVINFNHTDTPNVSSGESQSSENSSMEITSPADIYVKFGHLIQTTPKSILKKSISKGPDPETQPSPAVRIDREPEVSIIKTTSSLVVTQNVVERPLNEQPIPTTSTRPVSRFKAQRQATHKTK